MGSTRNWGNTQRVIIVTGAGASHAAAGLPLGREAADLLCSSQFGKENWKLETHEFSAELERLAIQFGLDREEFETRLLALRKFGEQRLLSDLTRIYGRRDHPSFVYDLIAHLLKHRFCDAVINFNFDELLDQAIDDELGEENYLRVVSDGDVPNDLQDAWSRPRYSGRPLYIKPHGTASHPQTLRFTRESYYLLPHALARMLQGLFQAAPVLLVPIGFRMQSSEFSSILRKLHRDSRITYINTALPESPKDQPSVPRELIRVTRRSTLESVLGQLWKAVTKCFRDTLCPRGVERHRFVSALLGSSITSPLDEGEGLDSYLGDRVVVEVGLAIAKAKGFINIAQLTNGRAGYYFSRLQEVDPRAPRDLSNYCDILGLVEEPKSYGRQAYRILDHIDTSSRTTLITSRSRFMRQLGGFMAKMKAALSPQSSLHWDRLARLPRKTLMAMYDGDEVETEHPRKGRFSRPFGLTSYLPTLTAFKLRTLSILQSRGWNRLLVVAESGQWLLEDRISHAISLKPRKHLHLIVADPIYANELTRRYEDHSIEINVMPWWLHNQHFTLVLSGADLLDGLYYERRLRALSISVFDVHASPQSRSLLETFAAYRIISQRFEKNSTIFTVSASDVRSELRDLWRKN
ncbi:MAG: SIR2 family protein [Planctomycetes bacterium]|nr:SIR2 family protein [Planctomycetota bacterium]